MRVLTKVVIEANYRVTDEGFVLYESVPIARIGPQVYGPGESAVPVGPEGFVIVDRPEAEVFRVETIESFNMKSLVDEHPPEDVNPRNWQRLTVGVVFNCRRGTGELRDTLVADILVTVDWAIKLILSGKRQLSCGYDADYVEMADGRYEQRDIIGNHVALVREGRCGERCSIHDEAPKELVMAKVVTVKGGWAKFRDSLTEAFKSKDEKKFHDAMSGVEEEEGEDTVTTTGDTHIHLGGTRDDSDYEARIKALEDMHAKTLEELKKLQEKVFGVEAEPTADAGNSEAEKAMEEEVDEDKRDEFKKTKDSAFFAESFQTTLAMAEIIAPGIHFPTFDSAQEKKKTFDSMCGLRRKALQVANNTPEGAAIIMGLRNGNPLTLDSLGKMGCGEVRATFLATGHAIKTRNQQQTRDTTKFQVVPPVGGSQRLTSDDVNKRNREFWAKQS